MKDKRRAAISRITSDLDVIAKRYPEAIGRIVKEKAGPKTTRYDSEGGRAGGSFELDPDGRRIPIATASDPTGDAAVARASGDVQRVDPALVAVSQIDAALLQIETATRALRSIVTDWSTTNPILAEDKGCEIVGNATGVFEPTHRRGFDHDGKLPERFRVGRWAYDFIRREDRLPTLQECRDHVEGRRVRT